MKESDGFDARSLRPREQKHWRLRLGAALGAVLVTSGLLLMVIGALALAGLGEFLEGTSMGRDTGFALLVLGLLLIWIGRIFWRRCRRRLRTPDELSLSPRLLKKRG